MRLPAPSALLTLTLSLLTFTAQPAWALHESDVGAVDWHKHLIGVPLSTAVATAPSFVDVSGNRSIIVTATGNNILAALEPQDGSVLWRHIFDSEDRIMGYYKSSKTIAALSGPGGATLRTFDALTGTLLLEKRLHAPSVGALSEPAHLGKQVLFGGDDDAATLYVLSNGCTVSSINATSGETLWTWTSPDQGSLTIYSDILLTPSALLAVGLSKSTASYTLHATSLALPTGELIHTTGIPSTIADPLTQFAVLSSSSSPSSSSNSNSNSNTKPAILWLSQSTLFYLPLSPSLTDKARPFKAPSSPSTSGLERIVDVSLYAQGHAVVGRNDGSAFVVRVEGVQEEESKGRGGGVSVKSVWEFEGSAASPTQADSFYTGGTDARGRSAVARVYWDHVIQKTSADVFAVQTPNGEELASTTTEGATTRADLKARAFAFGFDTRSHGVLSYVALEGPRPHAHARLLITTTTGAIQLWSSSSSSSAEGESVQEPTLHWTREEALAAMVVAEFVELPEKAAVSAEMGEGSGREEGFVGRLARQVLDVQDFPRYLVNFIRRFISGSRTAPTPSSPSNTSAINYRLLSNAAYPPPPPPSLSSSSSSNLHTATPPLARDAFGFRQLIITATLFGKVYALDAASGAVVWSRVLGMGWVGRAGMGGRVVPVKLFVVRAVGDLDVDADEVGAEGAIKGVRGPEVVLVGQRRADNSLVDTVVFHINALTGEDARPAARLPVELQDEILGEEGQGAGEKKQDDGGVLEGDDVVSGPLVEAYFLNMEERKIIVLLDEFLQTYLYPDTPATQAIFARALPKLAFPLRSIVEGRHRVVGHQIALPPLEQRHHRAVAHPVWALSFPLGEDVLALAPQAKAHHAHADGAAVASLGRVLGSRMTLYKYLDERLFLVRTVARKSAGGVMCGVYVVDGAKGTVVYHAEVKAAAPPLPPVGGQAGAVPGRGATAPTCDIKANLVENWLVYHYYESEVAGGSVGGAKGYRVVSVEFYEGQKPDEKVESSSLSAYSNDTLNYSVYEQAYVFPSAITALATTTTKFGITSKDLIVATANRKIQSFPRRIFDPRRPSRKTTAEEQEEFLIQYDPLIPNDPRRALSHNYDVANVQKIITSPALLESTSLVFAYGLDMFLTRVAPSNTFDLLSENFNKVQLVLTVTGLLVAILITRPMVKRKSLKEKWYN